MYCTFISRFISMKHQHLRFIAQIYSKDQFCMAYLETEFEKNFEKVYDTIDRHGMWQMKTVYGVGEKLMKAVMLLELLSANVAGLR